jgi:hypothetical protein
MAPAVAPPRCLDASRSRITHVLVSIGTLNYLASRGLDLNRLRWNLFEEFAARCLILVDCGPDFALYRVISR